MFSVFPGFLKVFLKKVYCISVSFFGVFAFGRLKVFAFEVFLVLVEAFWSIVFNVETCSCGIAIYERGSISCFGWNLMSGKFPLANFTCVVLLCLCRMVVVVFGDNGAIWISVA